MQSFDNPITVCPTLGDAFFVIPSARPANRKIVDLRLSSRSATFFGHRTIRRRVAHSEAEHDTVRVRVVHGGRADDARVRANKIRLKKKRTRANDDFCRGRPIIGRLEIATKRIRIVRLRALKRKRFDRIDFVTGQSLLLECMYM